MASTATRVKTPSTSRARTVSASSSASASAAHPTPPPRPSDKKFEETSFMRDLVNLKDTQESIQALSSWCLRQRKSGFKLTRCWLKVIKKVRVEQRVVLFHLFNDVAQHCKRKNVLDLLQKCEAVLKEAVPYLREEKIAGKILRVIAIWQEREVFAAKTLTEAKGVLQRSQGQGQQGLEEILKKEEQEMVDNFQPNQLCTQLKIMKALEDDTDYKMNNLKDNDSFDQIDMDSLRHTLKDRQHGNEFIQDYEEGRKRTEQYIKALERELTKRRQVIELLKQGGKYYESLEGEANIVATAYTNFGKRISNLKKKLSAKLPELEKHAKLVSISPIPSPPPNDYDAPSPGQDDEMELELPDEHGEAGAHAAPIAINQPVVEHQQHQQQQQHYQEPPTAAAAEAAAPAGASSLDSRVDSLMKDAMAAKHLDDRHSPFNSHGVPSSSSSTSGPSSSEKNFSISEFLTKLASGEKVDVDKFTGGAKKANASSTPADGHAHTHHHEQSSHGNGQEGQQVGRWWPVGQPRPGHDDPVPQQTEPANASPDLGQWPPQADVQPPVHEWPPAAQESQQEQQQPVFQSSDAPWGVAASSAGAAPFPHEEEPVPEWQIPALDEVPTAEDDSDILYSNNQALARLAARNASQSSSKKEGSDNNLISLTGSPQVAHAGGAGGRDSRVSDEMDLASDDEGVTNVGPPGKRPRALSGGAMFGSEAAVGGQNGNGQKSHEEPARPSLQDRLRSLAGVSLGIDGPPTMELGGDTRGPPQQQQQHSTPPGADASMPSFDAPPPGFDGPPPGFDGPPPPFPPGPPPPHHGGPPRHAGPPPPHQAGPPPPHQAGPPPLPRHAGPPPRGGSPGFRGRGAGSDFSPRFEGRGGGGPRFRGGGRGGGDYSPRFGGNNRGFRPRGGPHRGGRW